MNTHTNQPKQQPKERIDIQNAQQGVPEGAYHVDADALRQARQGVPTGEYHHQDYAPSLKYTNEVQPHQQGTYRLYANILGHLDKPPSGP